MTRLVSKIRAFIPSAVPYSFFGIERIKGAVPLGIKTHIVKDEKFRFRADKSRVAYPGFLQICLRFFCYIPGIAGIGFPRQRIHYVTYHDKRRNLKKRVHLCRCRIRNDQHIAGIYRLPSSYA